MANGEEFVWTFDYPQIYPRIGRIVAGRAGQLWVMEYPPRTTPRGPDAALDQPGQWVVLDSVGAPLAQVEFPPRLTPLEIGEDYVLFLFTDELGVQRVDLYGLERSDRDST